MEKGKKKDVHLFLDLEQYKDLKKRTQEIGIPVSVYIRLCFQKELKEKFLG